MITDDSLAVLACTVYAAAAEWAAARRAGLRALQEQTINQSLSGAMTRMANAEAALYALFPNAE